MSTNKDRLLVIRESDFNWLEDKAKGKCNSLFSKQRLSSIPIFPASEVFEAANQEIDENKPEQWKEKYGDVYYLTSGMAKYKLYPTYTDYENEKLK